jgi:hypothetical protein
MIKRPRPLPEGGTSQPTYRSCSWARSNLDETSSEIVLFISTNRGSRMPTSATSTGGPSVELGEGLGHQALEDTAGQGAHEDDAHALFIGLAPDG